MVKKVVFPVAGLGTRFLPATKASPKEMLPIVDKPLIQYAAEEAVEAGCTELIFVTGRSKRSIEDHFDSAHELESELEQRGKEELLELVRSILPKHVSCIYIRQREPLGLGHAVLCAQPVVGQDPFAVILADDLIYSDGPGCLSQMVKVHAETDRSVLAVQQIPRSDTDKYGIVSVRNSEGALAEVTEIVEKPAPEVAASTLGVVGRYVLDARVMKVLEHTQRGAGGEIQLTDAIAELVTSAIDGVVAYEFDGVRYDCGSKLGYLQATVEYGLRHPELRDDFRLYLESVAEETLSSGHRARVAVG